MQYLLSCWWENNIDFSRLLKTPPVPVATQYKGACGRSLAGIARSNPAGAWMFVCCECCVLSGRGLCDELITRPEEAYQLYCVIVCVLETSKMRKPRPALGRCATKQLKFLLIKCNVIHVQSRIMRWAGRVTRML